MNYDYLNRIDYDEFIDKNIGERLGAGISREVWEWLPDPKLVMKIARYDPTENVREHAVWEYADADLRERLCPIVWISECGEYMLMRRAKTLNKMPYLKLKQLMVRHDTMEAFMLPDSISWDLHKFNWGYLDDRPVVIDYAPGHEIEDRADLAFDDWAKDASHKFLSCVQEWIDYIVREQSYHGIRIEA